MGEANVSLGSLSGRSGQGDPAIEVDEDDVRRTLDVIRPALQADGGDIEYLRVDEQGRVFVRLVGACGSCPISGQELKGGVERILKDRVAGVTEVIDASERETVIG